MIQQLLNIIMFIPNKSVPPTYYYNTFVSLNLSVSETFLEFIIFKSVN